MELKTLLQEQIEREYEYLSDQEVGSEEYNNSMKRLNTLEDKLADLKKAETEASIKEKQLEEERKKHEAEASMKEKQLEEERKKRESEAAMKEKQLAEEQAKRESEAAREEKQMEENRKDRKIKNIFEGIKLASGVIVPMIGLVAITAAEKEITFCGALRGYVNLFIPKKL